MHSLSIKFLNKNDIYQDIVLNSSTTSVIGKNASGKTTFLKKLALPSKDIKLIFDNTDLNALSLSKRSLLLSWLPHCEKPSFNFKVMDFILLGRYPIHKGIPTLKDYQIAEIYLEHLGVKELKDRDILSLSKGEYQKINIVRVLICQTSLVILDEPFSNLDISSIATLVNLLKSEAQDKDRMIISSFHDVNIANVFSTDSFISLTKGKINFHTSISSSILESIYDIKLREIEGFYSIF